VEWLAVSVTTDRETAEAVADVFSRYAPSGVAIDMGVEGGDHPVAVMAYLSVDETLSARVQELEEGLWHLQQIKSVSDPTYTRVADQDWTVRWKETLPVLTIGERLVIKPSWREYAAAAGEIVLEIDPGQAFGTGLHPTTQLCLQALEQQIKPGMHILDLGTGSGILAIAAAKLVPCDILAVDTDAQAVTAARANVRTNDVEDIIRVRQGSLHDLDATYDLILANLLSNILVRMAKEGLADFLRPSGIIIASGILEEQLSEVTAAFRDNNLRTIDILQQDDWVTVIAEML